MGLTCFGRNFYCVASTDANRTTSDRTSIAMRSSNPRKPVRSTQGFRLEGVLHGRQIQAVSVTSCEFHFELPRHARLGAISLRFPLSMNRRSRSP